MLKQLRIQNFKGWKDTGQIRLAPITLFFGANSSGKSSIGQLLMMLKQTIESSDRKAVFYPGGRNSAVQLGSYQDMVYRRNPDNKIAFEYLWKLPEKLSIKDTLHGQTITADSISFSAETGLYGDDQRLVLLDHFNYSLMEKNDVRMTVGMKRNAGSTTDYAVEVGGYDLTRKKGRVWNPGAPVRFYGFPEEVVAYHQNADFVQSLNLRHEKLFRSISYLGPLRTRAERLYSWSGIKPENVGFLGENTIAAILASRKRKIGILKTGAKKSSPGKLFEEIIALKLKEMELIEELRVIPISDQRHEYEVSVRARGSDDWVDLPDVGFGISQVLPVLTQCFYAPPDSIIIMEQPEIHLHPRAQSALADVVIDVVNSREKGKDRNIQLIIESHSEHFLRRLQRRIAEEKISNDRVSVYFANIDVSPAKLEPLEIDIFGNILNWPEKFFGDEMEDITEHAKAALMRRMRDEKTTEADE
ncbi:MAG: DUF3696 domain-containing protein [Aminivibrio sp.]